MVRIVISMDEKDKKWLDAYSRGQKKSVAEVIRLAIKNLPKQNQKSSYLDAIENTYGIWKDKNIDGVEYQRKLRAEWDHR